MSAFTNECWMVVGRHNAVNPKGVEELFQTWEMEREQLAQLDAKHRETLDEMIGVYSELRTARKDLERFQQREALHIQPLFTAMLEHLRFPGVPSPETKATLRDRAERAQQFKVARGSVFTETSDAMAELEKQRAENAALAARTEALEKELFQQVEGFRQDEDDRAKKVSTLTAELEAERDGSVSLRKTISELQESVRRLETERAELVRIKAANVKLTEAIQAWKMDAR
jgi:septal ring factor EnvC (AmiA/AmiB activator)